MELGKAKPTWSWILARLSQTQASYTGRKRKARENWGFWCVGMGPSDRRHAKGCGPQCPPLPQHWWSHTGSTASSSGFLSTKEMWIYWKESNKGTQKHWRDWSIFLKRKDWEDWNWSAWRRKGSEAIWSMCITTWREHARMMKPGSSQLVLSDRWAQTQTQEVLSEH